MNLIAVILNDNGETCSWKDNGVVKLYKKDCDGWIAIKSIPYCIPSNCSINTLKIFFSELLMHLNGCKIFIAKEISGLLITILESHNFNSYELSGIPDIFLDSILISEKKIREEKFFLDSQIITCFSPQQIDTLGNFTINLKNLLNLNQNISSKQILMPFLKNEKFTSLEVICDHVPKWFDKLLSDIGYIFNIKSTTDGIISVIISAK